MRFFGKNKGFYIVFSYLVTVSVIALYAGWIYGLIDKGVLEGRDLVWSVTNLLGWVVALFIIVVHLKKTRKDQRIERQQQLKKEFKIDAFRRINHAVSSFSTVTVKAAHSFDRWSEKLKLHRQKPGEVKFSKQEVDREIDLHIDNLMEGLTQFVQAVEENEMAVVKFSHLKNYIQNKGEDINRKVGEFQRDLAQRTKKDLICDEGLNEFASRCKDIKEGLSDIRRYLFDYRSELMQDNLRDIFKIEASTTKKKKL
ncbi:MAG: hypothetical protein JW869_02075 [Candidatus Omnitrophica bacterium]|nr:hypothetical protein [Candidatus Omnitrophota bacterium]